MNRIIVRHYCTEQKCPPVEQTLETLQRLVAEMEPKLKNIGFNIELELLNLSNAKETSHQDINKVTISCKEMDFDETPLEEIIGVPVHMEPCPCGGDLNECRALIVEGKSFQALPPGLILDGILRVAFSALDQLGGTCGHSCDGCGGCGG
ncbi:DUF2703 domain-containing protein [Thermovirga sp.]|uniref:DUF2703 domain-containing protein n=1 Tax=Thermovirga sp. TaxID=2699834 RepID=UPI0025EFCAE0|nr:DUF2703 domain-containing protein [Thermovirga sp.]MBO8153896.1 DUF2703 domain-containing protein [Thermovirga sp.]